MTCLLNITNKSYQKLLYNNIDDLAGNKDFLDHGFTLTVNFMGPNTSAEDIILGHEFDSAKQVSINDPNALAFISENYPSSGAGKLVYAYGKLYRFVCRATLPSSAKFSNIIKKLAPASAIT